jgi:hypothetical protein
MRDSRSLWPAPAYWPYWQRRQERSAAAQSVSDRRPTKLPRMLRVGLAIGPAAEDSAILRTAASAPAVSPKTKLIW